MRKINTTLTALGFGALLTLVGCGGSDNSVEAFCGVMLDLDENDPTEGLEEGSDEWFEATLDSLQEAIDAAPSEIQDDVQAMKTAMEALSELADGDIENLDVSELEDIADDVEESGERLDNFMETNCEA